MAIETPEDARIAILIFEELLNAEKFAGDRRMAGFIDNRLTELKVMKVQMEMGKSEAPKTPVSEATALLPNARVARVRSDLLALCTGHPNAKVPWPHRELHEAVKMIDDLTSHLTGMCGYAESVLKQFKDGRGYLDMTGFHSLIEDSRTIMRGKPQ